KYQWIALLDADDLWNDDHLEEISKMMKIFPDQKVYTTSFEYSDGRKLFKHPRDRPIFKINEYFKEAIRENLIWTSVVVIHKECFKHVGGFNVKISRAEDLDMWARLGKQYPIVKSAKV